MSDQVEAIRRLEALTRDHVEPDHVWAFVNDGEPVSKARARFSSKTGKFYTPAKTRNAEEELAWRFKGVMHGTVLDDSIAIVAIFYRPDYRRMDVDNMMKVVLDAGTKAGVWGDDCQITAQASFIELDAERPRTVVALCETESSLSRMRSCAVCGTRFRRKHHENVSERSGLYCSKQCMYQATVKDQDVTIAEEIPCLQCGEMFRRRTSAQKLCSEACRVKWMVGRQQPGKVVLCADCGEPVPNRTAKRCRACWRVWLRAGRPNAPVS